MRGGTLRGVRVLVAIDTSTSIASVAVASPEGRLLASFAAGEASPRERSGRDVLRFVAELLDGVGASREEIAAVAVARGPGSFTGVRIGVGAALGVAMGLAVPVVGVSTLEAIVVASRWALGDTGLLPVAILPAGPAQVYLGHPGDGGARFRERAVSVRRLVSSLPRRTRLLLCGEGARQHRERVSSRGSVVLERPGPLAPAVAAAGAAALARGERGDPADLAAVYLRPSGALTPLMRARSAARAGR